MSEQFSEEYNLKLLKLQKLQEEARLREELPHLHGLPMYKWQREFFESTNRMNLLTAANQIGKSTIQIRKCIHWATEDALWPVLWKSPPRLFWYFYPSQDVIDQEVLTKWIPDYLPKKKDDPKYGWKLIKSQGHIVGIQFKSVTVMFHSYSQKVSVLQTATLWALFCDEELPESYYDELQVRLTAPDGYFHLVFTATLGQELWMKAMERRGESDEKFPSASKWQVSMYDCLNYEDGTRSHWTLEKIQRAINSCKSEAEVQRRIFGRFVVDSGLVIQGFDRKRNVRPGGPIPDDWLFYEGVDIGSGGPKNHPASIVFVAVSPDFKRGRVVRGWRGDGVVTTSTDILDKHFELKKELPRPPVQQRYDHEGKEFFNIASQIGEPFVAANKDREQGFSVLNVLFKNGMLTIDEEVEELAKLITEITTYVIGKDKSKAKDDFIDAARYCVVDIPWNWSAIGSEIIAHMPEQAKKPEHPDWNDIDYMRRNAEKYSRESRSELEDEIAAWNELMG